MFLNGDYMVHFMSHNTVLASMREKHHLSYDKWNLDTTALTKFKCCKRLA